MFVLEADTNLKSDIRVLHKTLQILNFMTAVSVYPHEKTLCKFILNISIIGNYHLVYVFGHMDYITA